jgi:CBS domain-containing protein
MSLKEELKAERVVHLNLSSFCQVTDDTSVRDSLTRMREEGHNVCLVTESGKLVGVFTDRDVLRKIAAAPEKWEKPIKEVMTPEPLTVRPDSSAADALWLMEDHHFRNLPVVDDDGSIIGNMTYRAVIDFLATRYPIEVMNRPPHPGQFPRKAEGG